VPRLVLVGSPTARARLRARLEDGAIQIVDEFPTLAAARAAGAIGDGVLMAESDESARAADRDGSEESDPGVEPLTLRERDVLELLAEGLPNKAIAGRLGISDQTVKFHVAAIYGKLGASNRTEAVRRGVRRGLITL
jgi:DNA-binding NarL/FixJ family response regulator